MSFGRSHRPSRYVHDGSHGQHRSPHGMGRALGLLSGLLVLALSPAAASAQALSASTYPFVATTSVPLEDMSSGTTTLVGPNQDSGVSSLASIGFDLWFVGTRYTQFSANSNGLLRLGGTVIGVAAANNLATATQVPQVAPYWDDLWTGTNGKVHYKVVGVAPARKLVVEWQNIQVPKVGTGLAGAATWQCWLSESSGRIEFVYGAGMAPNTAQSGASIGFGSSATAFASVTSTTPSVAYGTANNANTAAIVSGTRYSFAPPVPNAPSGLAFASVTAVGMTLNWTDVATNEVGYALYRSTDGISYSFVTQLAANATSSIQSGLNPSTTYFWKVYAVTEGALSASADGSHATSPAGSIVTGGSGNWSSTVPDAPWPGGVLPTTSDNVIVADGHTVTVDAAAICFDLTVGQGTTGALRFEATTARTLAVGRNLLVSAGGLLSSAATGTQAGHVLTVAGKIGRAHV